MEQTTQQLLDRIAAQIKKAPADWQGYSDYLSVLMQFAKTLQNPSSHSPSSPDGADRYTAIVRESLLKECHHLSAWCRNEIARAMSLPGSDTARLYAEYNRSLLFDAPVSFDAYMLYLESKRLPESRFYQPRRKILRFAVDGLQALIDDDIDELFISMPPRVGKTSLMAFFYTWVLGRYPDASNLYSAYSDIITKAFYNAVLEILRDKDTYLWNDVFPEAKIVGTNGDNETININKNKHYPSLTCRSLYGTLNGACDCNMILASDDLLSGIEEALNPNRLTSAWSKVDNNLLTRGVGKNVKFLWVGTRWSIGDPAGRRLSLLENDPKYASRRYRVISLPALNDKDESNFDYDYGVGFTTEYYQQRRASFEHNNDLASWLAQYQQMPIEREGVLFSPDTMRYFTGEADPEGITRSFMAVDPAFGGGDFVAGPVTWKTEDGDLLIMDVIYDDSDKKITIPRLVEKVLKYNVRHIQFAVTKMTASYRESFEEELKKRAPEYRCLVTSKPDSNQSSKHDRIFEAAPDIRDLMVFLDAQHRTKEYNQFMQNVFSFTVFGRNVHDDAPDSLQMAMDMVTHPQGQYRVFKRPF